MSAYTGKAYDETYYGSGHRSHGCGSRFSRSWRPAEIAAMVLGFMVFWPIGLAVIGWKIWQKRSGYEGDLMSFLQEKWQNRRSFSAAAGFSNFGFRSSGNSAFDDWREAELARLEEERKKLAAAEQEFANFMTNLRRARDREEFDRFMNERQRPQN
jgi:hypothetical protein